MFYNRSRRSVTGIPIRIPGGGMANKLLLIVIFSTAFKWLPASRTGMFVLLLLSVFRVQGQDYSLHNFTVKDGLPSQEVYCSLQDHQGRIWFGTDAGVSVYNGFHFKNYSTKDGLLDNSVFAMCEDSAERIWFATLNRKVFYFDQGRFFPARNSKGDTIVIPDGHVLRMFVNDHVIYWNTSYKTYSIRQEGKNFRLDSVFAGGSKASVQLVRLGAGKYGCIHFRGRFYGSEIQIELKRDGKVISYSVPNFESHIFPMFWTVKEINDTVIYTFGKAVYMLNPDGTATATKHAKDVFYSDWSGRQLVLRSEELGMRYYNIGDYTTPLQQVFPGYTITSVFEDHEGGYWFTSLENGVFYSTSFGCVRTPVNAADNINIKCIRASGNRLWVSNKSGKLQAFDVPARGSLQPVSEYLFSNDNVLLDFESDRDHLYAATRNGLYLCSVVNDKLDKVTLHSRVRLRDISPPDKGRFYGLSRNSFFSLAPDSVISPDPGLMLPEAFQVYACNDTVYFGGTNGFYSYSGGKFSRITIPGISELEHIHVITRNKQGRFFLGTEESGLVLFDKGQSLVIGKAAGLIDNNITALVFSSDTTLWVSTKRGVSRVSIRPGMQVSRIENFDISNGLINDNITTLAYFKNHLCFGTKSGFFAIHEDKLKQNTKRPQVFIDEVENLKARGTGNVFRYDENDLRLHISVSSFRNLGNIPVKYKLRKDDTTFYYQTTSKGVITLLQLEPGEYDILIYAANNNGVWSAEAARYGFTIEKPFWRENYFWILLVVGVVAGVMVVARFRVSKITRREKEKAEFEIQIENLKNQALRLQMNPHFLFNALNAIQGFYANEDKALAKNYIYNLSRLLRLILESSKEDAILLEDEIEIIRCYLDLTVLRFEDKLEYTIRISDDVPVNRLLVPPMIMQPFIENAFIHGIAPKEDKGRIEVAFRIENDMLVCTVTDDGIGRKASGEKKLVSIQRSSGINITRDRIALLNKKHDSVNTVEIQDLYENGKAAGTQVILKLIIKKTDYA